MLMAEAIAKKEAKETKPRKRKAKVVVTRGKRKTAVARASVYPGTGIITINGIHINAVSDGIVRETILEPFSFIEGTPYDAELNVSGGGVMGQAQACRTALARGLVEISKDEELRKRMLDFDRSLLIEDPRRVEPKKFKGPKARARFTKSYR